MKWPLAYDLIYQASNPHYKLINTRDGKHLNLIENNIFAILMYYVTK